MQLDLSDEQKNALVTFQRAFRIRNAVLLMNTLEGQSITYHMNIPTMVEVVGFIESEKLKFMNTMFGPVPPPSAPTLRPVS